MTVWLTGVRKNAWRRNDSAIEMVTLHLGEWPFRWRQPTPTFLECQNNGFRQGFSDALRKANELVSGLVDGLLTVIMSYLRS